MSLINQMLRDLDARRGPASHVEAAALQGMGLADTPRFSLSPMVWRTGLAAGLVVAGMLFQFAYQSWQEQQDSHVPSPPVNTALPETRTDMPQPGQTATTHATQEAGIVTPPAKISVADTPVSTGLVSSPAPLVSNDVAASEDKPTPEPTPVTAAKKVLTTEETAQRHYNRAQGLLKNGNLHAATVALQSALELEPGRTDTRIQLAGLWLQQGLADKAHGLLQSGYQTDPGSTPLAVAYTRLLADRQEYASALEILTPVLNKNGTSPDLLALSAGIHYRLGQYRTSANQYRAALSLHPEQGVWWMGLGVSLEHDRKPAEALAAYRKAQMTSLNLVLRKFITGRINALSRNMD
ncbi:tetratricopeptide repeat protein [Thiogranum longum]|uniref:Tetratricopeptide repeat protein n=1 Tax=Thiogranum longum TaxID=1537524 RepID=A0A4R1H8N4_9GAMM|nr:tetratricopeptide repeat protein [Thiogranum longum]TCK16871.1 tetratricopeptide repeat protein [Thiogranum longum]